MTASLAEQSMRDALEFAAVTVSSEWPERCQEIVRRARAALTAPPAEPTLRASEDGAYAVSQDVHWRYDLAPRSTKIFLLNAGGVAIAPGPWSAGCIAWHPLFKRDKDEEARRGIT